MTNGIMTAAFDANVALKPIGGIIVFTDMTARALCVDITRKAARAQGGAAMLRQAIDSGDFDHAALMEVAATELSEGLQALANIAGQMQAKSKA